MRIITLFALSLTSGLALLGPGQTSSTEPNCSCDVPNVRDFGAKGDGVTDDTDAIQAALDYVKPGAAVMNSTAYGSRTGRVFLPLGHYIVRRPLKLYSGVWLDGAGLGSTIEAAGDFPVGGALLRSSTEGLSPQGYGLCSVTNLHLKAPGGTGIWAFSHAEMTRAGTLRAENLLIETPKGFDLTPYTQNSSVKNIVFMGEVDQMLRVKGNFNTFEQLDKEGSTGNTTDPYIQIEKHATGLSASNHFRAILIEQVTSPRKTLLAAVGTDSLILEDVWLEPTKTNGYGVLLDDSKNFQIRGHFAHIGRWGKVAIRNGSWGAIDTLNADGEDSTWSSAFEIDQTSFLRSGVTFTRRSGDVLPLDKSSTIDHGVVIDRMLSTAPQTGVSPVSRQRSVAAQNLLVNPSFEVGAYGWVIPQSFRIQDFPRAEIGPGSMLHISGSSGAASVYQELVIPKSWVGHFLTLSFAGRVVGKGFLAPYVKGAGLDLNQGSHRIDEQNGWVLTSVTFKPQTEGRIAVGIWFAGAGPGSHAFLDEVRLAFGAEGGLAGGQFQQIELGKSTLTSGSGPPRTGTWKPGDLVLNEEGSLGAPLGWQAVRRDGALDWNAIAVGLRTTVDSERQVLGGQACVDLPLQVLGARAGAECAAGSVPPIPNNIVASCLVSDDNRASVRLCNVSPGSTELVRTRFSVRIFNP